MPRNKANLKSPFRFQVIVNPKGGYLVWDTAIGKKHKEFTVRSEAREHANKENSKCSR